MRKSLALVALQVVPSWAAGVPFTVGANLFDQSDTVALGLSTAPGTETFTVFQATATSDHYCNGVALIPFKGMLYCQWQSSAVHEDSTDTWVAYSRSSDGKTWSSPMKLAVPGGADYKTSGGWWVNGDTLVAYVNVWPSSLSPRGGNAYYATSVDGLKWSSLKALPLADGSAMKGIVEQDPHALPGGRILNAAHFQPGLLVSPIYTDDPSGIRGWKRATYTNLSVNSNVSREIELSWSLRSDGAAVMVFRDQSATYLKLASVSLDSGKTWSTAVETAMPDSRAKQSAGNLPDGTAFQVSNPVNGKRRTPLAITLSKDGKVFDKAYVLRKGGGFLPALQYAGKAKTLGYSYPKSCVWNGFLYAGYAVNKEAIAVTRVPLSSLQRNGTTGIAASSSSGARLEAGRDGGLRLRCEGRFRYEVLDLSGRVLEAGNGIGAARIAREMRPGLVLVRIRAQDGAALLLRAVRP